ncbi:MAG: radical SAM protein [Deltaproteobacteria bacterium]|nr:radical SAM protein [Deltaproteobacteria bacterium]
MLIDRPTNLPPPRVTFHLTDRCRYECKFCFVPPIRHVRDLSTEHWTRAARDLAEAIAGVEIVMTGGEPIFHKGVWEILEAATSRGAVIHFNTSGPGIGPEEARRLAEVGVAHVNLSLDGPAPVHNFLRGHKDAYRLAQEALDNLAANAPDTRRNVVCVVMGANLAALPEFLDELDADERVSGVYFQIATNPLGPTGPDDWRNDRDLMHPERTARLAIFDELVAKKRAGAKVLNPETGLAAQRLLLDNPDYRAQGVCNVHDFGFCVDVHGDVSLCGVFEPAGNIARESLRDILRGDAYRAIVARMRQCEIGCHRQVNCAGALAGTG